METSSPASSSPSLAPMHPSVPLYSEHFSSQQIIICSLSAPASQVHQLHQLLHFPEPTHTLHPPNNMRIESPLLLITLSQVIVMISCRSMQEEIGKMRYKSCSSAGSGRVDWVKISGCTSDPCVFTPRTDVTITVQAVAMKDIHSAKLQAYLEGMKRPFPGFAMDICEHTPCPIKKGTTFQLKQTVKIPVVPTRVMSDVNFVATTADDTELLACVQVHVILDDGRQHVLPPISAREALERFEAAKQMIDPFGFSDLIMSQSQSQS